MSEQKYYFRLADYPNAYSYSGKIKTGKLQKLAMPNAIGVAKVIAPKVWRLTHSSNEIRVYWTTRTTFGFIFTDFEKSENTRFVLGRGRKQLFGKVRDEFYCVVLSDSLPHNFRTFEIEEGRIGLIININYFRKFSDIIKFENFVGLFLYKFDNEEIATLIRSWVTDTPDRFKKLLDEHHLAITDVATVLEKYQIDNLEELSDFLSQTTRIIRSRIEENYNLFLSRLQNFKDLVDKEKQLDASDYGGRKNIENEIRDFIRANPWLIDFTYDEKSVNLNIHKNADIVVVDSYLNLKRAVILEIKIPEDEIIKKYRGGDALRAVVPNAIAQLIRYMMEAIEKFEKKGDEKIIVEGVVVVGRSKELFIQWFNRFLHGITIKTYEDLYDDTKKRLENFAKGPKVESETLEQDKDGEKI